MSTIASAGARFGQALSEEKPLQITGTIKCVQAGTRGIFAEAAHDLPNHETFDSAIRVPLLANTSEFGQPPLLARRRTLQRWRGYGTVPLSAFRAMNMAAENVYTAIGRDGHQKNVIDQMQPRDELYDRIGHHDFEQKLDALFTSKK